MATIQQIQNYLRQKRSQGRLSPDEIAQAYRGYFGAESDASLGRAQHELEAKRQAEASAQADRRLQMQAVRDREARHAAEVQGRLQLAKMAVPSLFQADQGGQGGGAQFGTRGLLGGYNVQAVSSLDDGLSDVFSDPNRGKYSSVGLHNFGTGVVDSLERAVGVAALPTVVGGPQAGLAAGGMSLAKDAGQGAWKGIKNAYARMMDDTPSSIGEEVDWDVFSSGPTQYSFDISGLFGDDGGGAGDSYGVTESFGAGGGTSAGFGGTGLGGR